MTSHKRTKQPTPLDLLVKLYRPAEADRQRIRHRHDCQHWQGEQCDCEPETLHDQAGSYSRSMLGSFRSP